MKLQIFNVKTFCIGSSVNTFPHTGQGPGGAQEGQEGGPARAEDHRGAAIVLRTLLPVQHAARTGEDEVKSFLFLLSSLNSVTSLYEG